jgi:putative flippase GtrA
MQNPAKGLVDRLRGETRQDTLALPKFLIVGMLGTLTNLAVFFVIVDLRKWNPTIGAIVAFAVAVAQNYVLNHFWTFAHQVRGASVSVRGYVRFVVVALVALGINLVVLWIVLAIFDPPWKVIAQAAGILSGTAINYVGSKFWVFVSHE